MAMLTKVSPGFRGRQRRPGERGGRGGRGGLAAPRQERAPSRRVLGNASGWDIAPFAVTSNL